ncbi:unnamed protein product [Adineta ricciae]|uniref:Right handed beta helix domain-containing protein n=1 Tax=Adineta ricciae TaxID=249248 RepID=A0A814PZA4_ADIRI|nr:unnamed protein product [Adineta ricciae]CAF1287679.1 unnamed protein product [Adineta ricciae]
MYAYNSQENPILLQQYCSTDQTEVKHKRNSAGMLLFTGMSLILLIVIYSSDSMVSCSLEHRTTKYSAKIDPRYGRVRNPNVALKDDCALRAFTIEMAGYIAPPFWKGNWTTLSESAFQMDECNETIYRTYRSSNSRSLFANKEKTKADNCYRTVFVNGKTGDDRWNGTFEMPLKTIQTAVLLTRTFRITYGRNNTMCIVIREGTYYLGANATTSSSQMGVIQLTSADSNLVIQNYLDERVILSGGTLLPLQWSVHAKTTTNGTIMKAKIPSYIDLEQFNELYIDGKRAILAKYPNGDPSTQGLYAKNPGFCFEWQKWWGPTPNRSLEVHVQVPFRNGTVFTNFQLGVGGGAYVFDPPTNFWSTAAPPGGDNYVTTRGITVNKDTLPHMSNWTKSTAGLVHTFQGEYWGSWIFQIGSVNSTEYTIMFGRGGFQEARGLSWGGAFYVANIFEELDSPNEWFLDKDSRTLYFMPNETMPNTFVASQVPCLISLRGISIDDPIYNVRFEGLILSETTSTYMREYMVPGGGDWAVHRGGTLYLMNTKDVSITRNLFTQLGSNGIALIDYNDATSIVMNEFVWLADSAIILVGSTNGIDGFSVRSQPANTLIQSNLMHETGIYNKQSSPVLIAVSRSASVIGNLMFNVPRAAININDGYYGNHTLSWNVMFNTVRETSDHGPINTWDRQPFLSDATQPGVPSLWQHYSYIHHNTIFNNYNALWPIDHDDGSCFYEDSYNFHVYGGKKNFLGHSKKDHHQIYVYADMNRGDFGSNTCLGFYAPRRGFSGWNEVWMNSTCVLYKIPVPYVIGNCDTADLFVPYLANNKIYIPNGTEAIFPCNINGTSTKLSFKQWQSYGVDNGTIIDSTPDVQTIIEWGRQMLQTTI